jgi:hypothetical protein
MTKKWQPNFNCHLNGQDIWSTYQLFDCSLTIKTWSPVQIKKFKKNEKK